MASLPGGLKIKGDRPTWKEKRDILADASAPPEGLIALAKMIEEAGQLEEAADFYARADDTAAVERLHAGAVQEGDTFLWLKTCRLMGKLPFPADEGRALAAKARADGRLFDARAALDAVDDADGVAEVEQEIPTALPYKPVEVEIADAVEEFDIEHADEIAADAAADAADAARAREHVSDDDADDDEPHEGGVGVAKVGG